MPSGDLFMLTLRPITPADQEFLFCVYASTRQEELAITDWSGAQKEVILHQQFAAQHQYYQEYYTGSTFDIIEVDGQPAGRLYLARWADEFRIIDIALLPEFRRRGLGQRLLQDILVKAGKAGLPVTIHVERNNPALSLYTDLGFELAEDKGVYLFLKWEPEHA